MHRIVRLPSACLLPSALLLLLLFNALGCHRSTPWQGKGSFLKYDRAAKSPAAVMPPHVHNSCCCCCCRSHTSSRAPLPKSSAAFSSLCVFAFFAAGSSADWAPRPSAATNVHCFFANFATSPLFAPSLERRNRQSRDPDRNRHETALKHSFGR